MANSAEWYVRSEDGKVYGPADLATLVSWAEDGRVEPTGFVSKDRRAWTPSQLLAELQMKWLIELEPGKVFGPFNRAFAIKLFQSGSVPVGAKAYRLHELGIEQDPPPVIVEKIKEVPVEKIVEKVVEKEVRVEVPVEKVVERVVEVLPPSQEFPLEDSRAAVPTVMPRRGAEGNVFGYGGKAQLAALEAAAARELVALRQKQGGGGFLKSFFGRKRP